MQPKVNNRITISRFRYEEIRDSIRDGDMFFCVGESEISRGIIAVTKKKSVLINGEKITPSHIGFFDWHRKQLMCLEASKKVHLTRFSLEYTDIRGTGKKYNGRIFLARHTMVENVEIAMNRMSEKIGLDYDTDAILSQLVNKIAVFGIRKNIPNNKWFCSELGNYGYNHLYGGETSFVTPVDIAVHKTTKFICEIII